MNRSNAWWAARVSEWGCFACSGGVVATAALVGLGLAILGACVSSAINGVTGKANASPTFGAGCFGGSILLGIAVVTPFVIIVFLLTRLRVKEQTDAQQSQLPPSEKTSIEASASDEDDSLNPS